MSEQPMEQPQNDGVPRIQHEEVLKQLGKMRSLIADHPILGQLTQPQLDVFEAIRGGAHTTEQINDHIQHAQGGVTIPDDMMRRLVASLVLAGLVELQDFAAVSAWPQREAPQIET